MGTDIVNLADRLRELGHDYHHLQHEHHREARSGATRRRLERRMAEEAERFESLVEHWIDDEELRAAWKRHLYDEAPAPDAPRFVAPPLYRGRTDAGNLVEVRPAADGRHEVVVDGAILRHEAVPWHLEPDLHDPAQIGGLTCHEVFTAPDEAVRALAAHLATPGSAPPWRHARALFEDGLVGVDFTLTPRGQRRLARRPGAAAAEEGVRTAFCVLVADAARARVLTLETDTGPLAPTLAPLVEVAAITNPERRARDSDVLGDSRPGVRREAPGTPGHGLDDQRDRRRREVDRVFANHAVDEAARVWKRYRACRVVVVASPAMLGELRKVLPKKNHTPTPYDVSELSRDLSRLAPPALHDALAGAGLLPARGRRAPTGPGEIP
jgi:protein required for attachment to host cells